MTSIDAARTPVIAAVGQVVDRTGSARALDLAERAASMAFDSAPRLRSRIDLVSVPQILSPSSPAPATRLSNRLGLSPQRCETTTTGGNTPQWLATRAARQIANGDLRAALVVGAEAMASALSGSAGAPEFTSDVDPVVGDTRPGTNSAEDAAGLALPAWTYPLFESAVAATAGRDIAEHREALGEMLAPFTEVAARRPEAWFPEARQAVDISGVTPDNRVVAEPYTKRMCSVLGVDQAAAFVVCSLEAATAAGVEGDVVYVWSGADCNDVWFPSHRRAISESPAIAAAGQAVLSACDVGIDDISMFDLYSCFPVAVEVAAKALGIGTADSRGTTLTGGLPYFGGPGNNYVSHSIATMVDDIRDRGGMALITGLGWFLTKHSVGIYGDRPPPRGFAPTDMTAAQATIDATAAPVVDDDEDVDESALIEAATVAYDRDGRVVNAPAFLRLEDDRRIVASAHRDEWSSIVGVSLVGRRALVSGSPRQFRLVG